MPADSWNGMCADTFNQKVPYWLEVPSLSASTWMIIEMSNNVFTHLHYLPSTHEYLISLEGSGDE